MLASLIYMFSFALLLQSFVASLMSIDTLMVILKAL